MKVRAVFFDLFETLITEFSDGRRISRRSYDYEKRLGLSETDFKQEWKIRFNRRMEGHFPTYQSVIRDILEMRSLPYHHDHVESLYQSRVKEKIIPFETIRPDIIETLDCLSQRGMKLGLISNCSEEEVTHWSKSSLAPYFDDVVLSYEVGVAKPQEGIYRMACERLSVAPEESIFIGDGGSDELSGAGHAGLMPYHAYWFNTYVESDFKKLYSPLDILGIVEP